MANQLPPTNEAERLVALKSYRVLDTTADSALDDLTFLASQICGTPIALISLIDESRQWFLSNHGLNASQTPRDVAFCAHAVNDPTKVMIVPDAQKDARFVDNPMVTGDPNIRFYAGRAAGDARRPCARNALRH